MFAFLHPSRVNYARLLKLVILPNVAFGLSALIWTGPQIITALNAALFALASGVVISFLPDALRVLLSHKPMLKVHWLVLGLTLAWTGTLGTRAWSAVWRWMGQPLWLADSLVVAYCLLLGAYGAYFHLASSEAIGEERIPRAKWVRYGALAAAGILLAILIGYAVERFTQAELLIRGFG